MKYKVINGERIFICPFCGADMYDEWDCGDLIFHCSECVFHTMDCKDDGSAFDMEYEIAALNELSDCYSEEPSMSYACRACGNPAYPNCTNSCNLYDD